MTQIREWHYFATKVLLALLSGVTSKHVRDFYLLVYLYSFQQKYKLESHKKLCETRFLGVKIFSDDTKML